MNELSEFLASQFERFFAVVDERLPSVAAAVVILLAGWLFARLVKAVVLQLGAATARLSRQAGLARGLRYANLPFPLSVILGNVAFWLIILLFLSLATHVADVPAVAAWLQALLGYLPVLLASAAVVLLGYLLAVFLRDSISSTGKAVGLENARLLGQTVFLIVLIVTLIVGIGQLGVDVTLLAVIVAVAASALFGAMGLAFGLGASASVDNIIAVHYLKRLYQSGQRVRVGRVEGVILEITPTAVVIDAREGRAVIPARKFNDEVSILLDMEVEHDGR